MTNPLRTFSRPYDWPAIDTAIRKDGGVIVQGLMDEAELAALDREIDSYLDATPAYGSPDTGSASYDTFLGYNTVRLHGLVEKFPSAHKFVGHPEIVQWAQRMLENKASSVLLNAGELIQINPGEPHQAAHRDTDSWPIALESNPIIVNAIVAFDEFTEENGATAVAPGSWDWEPSRRPRSDEYVRAIMQRGDALLFRGDVIHGGAENRSPGRRRALSLSYCAGWLRPVENSYLNVSQNTLLNLPEHVQCLLGYAAHDGGDRNAGMVGLYENGDPRNFLQALSRHA